MTRIEELKEDIQSLEEFIEIADEKLEKLERLIELTHSMISNPTLKRNELKALVSEYCRISEIIDDAKVDMRDKKLQIERLEKSDEGSSGIKKCYLVIEL